MHWGVALHGSEWGTGFLEVTPRAKMSRAKIDKLNLTKSGTSVLLRIPSRKQRQPTGWETVFANNMSDEGSVGKIQRNFLQLDKKTAQPNLKMGKG